MSDFLFELVVASGNPHKVQEIAAIFEHEHLAQTVRLLSLAQAGGPFAEPAETARTFEANARLKALAYATLTNRIVLADDSGLEVDALGGEPGVDSAIWAGAYGDREQRDARNNAKLMQAMRGVEDSKRTARFVCAMCVATAQGDILAESRGECAGVIAQHAKGSAGFGYDAYFLVGDSGVTSAELDAQEKNKVSHRGHAARLMALHLHTILKARVS